MDVSVSKTIDQKTYLKKFRGGFSPLSPPGSAYENVGGFNFYRRSKAIVVPKSAQQKTDF